MLHKIELGNMRGWVLPRQPCCVPAANIGQRSGGRRCSGRHEGSPRQIQRPLLGASTISLRSSQRFSARSAAAASPSASPDSPDILAGQSPPAAAASHSPASAPDPDLSPSVSTSNKARRSGGPGAERTSQSARSGGAASRAGGGDQRARAGGSSPAASAAAAQAAADALFTDPGPGPLKAPRVGPVRVAELGGGRCRGLVTTRTVQPGELLLAVRPLALAWDEQYDSGDDDDAGTAAAGRNVENDPADAKFLELQRQLLGRKYTGSEAAWLASLAGLPPGAEEGEEGGQRQGAGSDGLPPPPELESCEGEAEGDEARPRDQPLPGRLRDPGTLADVVQANCLEPDGGAEDEHAFWARWDAAAAASPSGTSAEVPVSSGRRRRGPMGLWPEAALLNHSCIPNTVAYVVGDTLFVRAARKVGGGSELTVSYLPVGSGYGDAYDDDNAVDEDGGDSSDDGDDAAAATLLSPLAVRRGPLEELRGFVCRCSRCTAEESLDPKLRALMADISEGVAALRSDLRTALALAEFDEDGEEGEGEDEEEEEAEAVAAAASSAPGRASGGGATANRGGDKGVQRRRGEEAEDEEDAEEEGGEEEGGGRWRDLVGSVVDRAGMYLELMDAAMVKLKLSPAQQMTAQSAVAPLYTVLWAALGSRGELEPRLGEVMAALVGEVAPGSADHLWWAVVARETAEMIVAEEEAAEEATVVRRGSGGGFSRPQDDRVTIADKTCYKAFGVRYGPLSRGVYRRLLAARRQREDGQQQLQIE